MWKPQGLYTDFMLYQPAIFFGETAVMGLANFPCATIVVIHGNALPDGVKEIFQKVFKKKALYFLKRTWGGEPDFQSLRGTVQKLEELRPDLIIAVGGGSTIDGTKLSRLLYEFPYFKPGETRLGLLSFKTKFIAIPTTIGSGAEVSSAAVYINREKHRKEMIVSHDLLPSVVILNNQYVKNAPHRILAASLLDTVGHIVEGYVSVRNNDLADILAETGLKIIYGEWQKSSSSRDFTRLQYAGYLGGIVQNHCIVGAAHAIAHQLSEYGYSHGEAVALLLLPVIRLNCTDVRAEGRYEKLCCKTGIGSTDDLLNFISQILIESEIGQRRAELKTLLIKKVGEARFTDNVIQDQGGKGNPIPLTAKYINKLVGEYL